MSLLVKAAPGRVITDITPASAGWKHIGFKALRLQANDSETWNTGGLEQCITVLSGEVDFGVVIEPDEKEALTSETIHTEPFCLACPPEHRLAGKRQVRWTDLNGESLVLLDHASGSRRLIDKALLGQNVQCTVAQEVGHPTTIFRMLEAGLGVSVIPQLAIPPQGIAPLVVRALTPQIDRQVMLVHRRNRALSPLAQTAWQLIREVAASMDRPRS